MNAIKLALFGLMPDTSARLKIIIEKKLSMPVSWGNAVDSDVAGVIVNAEFLNSKNIQRYINHSVANIVCSYSDDFGHDLSNKYKIVGLDINDYNDQQCSAFIDELTKKSCQADTLSEKNESEKNTYLKKGNANYKSLIEKIKQSNHLIHAVSGDQNNWIDTRTKKVYFDYDRNSIPAITNLVWSEVELLTCPDDVKKECLDVWLFESLWETNFGDDLNSLSHNNLYSITRWIHPLNHRNRTEIIRLAAFAQKYPISIESMVEKTGYSEQKVKQFFYAYLLTGWLKVTPNSQKQVIRTKDKEPDKRILGMLGRLRKKIFS